MAYVIPLGVAMILGSVGAKTLLPRLGVRSLRGAGATGAATEPGVLEISKPFFRTAHGSPRRALNPVHRG